MIGGAPRYDTDHRRRSDRIFALAREYDCDVDLHLDVGDDAPITWTSIWSRT